MPQRKISTKRTRRMSNTSGTSNVSESSAATVLPGVDSDVDRMIRIIRRNLAGALADYQGALDRANVDPQNTGSGNELQSLHDDLRDSLEEGKLSLHRYRNRVGERTLRRWPKWSVRHQGIFCKMCRQEILQHQRLFL